MYSLYSFSFICIKILKKLNLSYIANRLQENNFVNKVKIPSTFYTFKDACSKL